TELSLIEDETATLTATVVPENATDKSMTWTSSDTTIVTVDANGNVTAVKAGTATITATSSNEKVATCSVTVSTKIIEATGITLNETSVELKVGEYVELVATVEPANTTDKTLEWISSNETVAIVDSEGNVKAVGIGTVTIRATSEVTPEVYAECTVIVKPIAVASITLDRTEWSGHAGEEFTIITTVLPEDATDKKLEWTSSDETVASVDSEGNVKAIGIGMATIRVASKTTPDVYAECSVTVKPIAVASITLDRTEWSGHVGDEFTISATVFPENATDKTLEWTSSDETVAIVDSEGNVKAVGIGTATIRVASKATSDVYAECSVAVEPIAVASITLDRTEWMGHVGEEFTIITTVLPEDATDKKLEWTSSDETVASVDSEGNVKAIGIGTATIRIASKGAPEVYAECSVAVESIAVASITLDRTEWSGHAGEEFTIITTVLPEDATDKKLEWTSSDETVASVDSEGNVKAIGIGMATIRVASKTTPDVYAECSVTVKPIAVASITLDRTEWSGHVGDEFTISATVFPENATDKTLEWTSSDETVAIVDSEGNVKAVGIGTATIRVASKATSDVYAECSVAVEPIAVASITLDRTEWSGHAGEEFTINATVFPEDATDKTLEWTSSDESVATVDSEGNVKAVGIGTATIRVASNANPEIYAECSVTVEPIAVTSITLDRSEWSCHVGEELTINATVLPEDATDKSVIWTSSNNAVATVDFEGNVTAVALGEADITITAYDGSGVRATCHVTVLPVLVEAIILTPDNWSGEEGMTFQIEASVLPDNATDKKLKWTSSDKAIAIVDEDGLVAVLKEGTCLISATATDGSGIYAECIITSSAGIDEIFNDGETSWNVFDINGALLKKNCDKDDLKLLSSGIYILQSGNKIIKIIIR
ncbi:MAG: Ig-like domain-containing protein, partial [Muribaculaceae bacterium]|nr:Ig-like domain-containing protein [Muribaculaceae bacterium]